MPKCTFCGNSLPPGMGKMFVYVNGKVIYFCSNKCEKNLFKLGRKPLRVKWTEAARKVKKTGVKLVEEEVAKPNADAAVEEKSTKAKK
jgi:large subunit ribosomal protein L24e